MHTVFRLIRDNMSSENIPSVTQSLFRGHLLPTLALLWNVPCSFLRIFCLEQSGQAPGHLSAAHLICQLTCRSPKGRHASCRMRRQRSIHVKRWSCVMSLVLDILLRVAILNIDMRARAQSEKIWEDYEGLKFYLRMTVVWTIGDIPCENTDSIFSPGPISCFVYHSANRTLL